MKRFLYSNVLEHTKKKHISLIIGARQVGKTTLLRQLEKELITQKNSVHYFSLEDYDILEMLNESPKNLFKLIPSPSLLKGRVYLLIDEIQYLNNPSNFLKYHYDKYGEQLKFIVTGSSSFYIDQKFKDSLAGRKRIFELPTLSLAEVLYFKGEFELLEFLNKGEPLPLLYKEKLTPFFYDYLIYGGYPEVVLTDDIDEKITILKELSDSYAKKDILESQLSKGDAYIHLMKILAERIGALLNVNTLTSDIKLDNKTILNYIWVMRKSFHIHLVSPFYKNIASELRKMSKLYFGDLGLRNALMNDFSSIGIRKDKGDLLENYVYLLLKEKYGEAHINYWRTQSKNEVDFIVKNNFGKYLAYEVKYHHKSFSLTKYKSFTKNYPDIPLECIDLDSVLEV